MPKALDQSRDLVWQNGGVDSSRPGQRGRFLQQESVGATSACRPVDTIVKAWQGRKLPLLDAQPSDQGRPDRIPPPYRTGGLTLARSRTARSIAPSPPWSEPPQADKNIGNFKNLPGEPS
jgi:hypothetical protein